MDLGIFLRFFLDVDFWLFLGVVFVFCGLMLTNVFFVLYAVFVVFGCFKHVLGTFCGIFRIFNSLWYF